MKLMGYEIWDRDAAFLLEDFDTEDQALAYLRQLVGELSAEDASRTMDRLQLVRLADRGETRTVLAEGVALFERMYALARTE